MDMDQTQMDKLSILLDPDNEFLWTPETEKKVYDKFAELVDAHEVRMLLQVQGDCRIPDVLGRVGHGRLVG